MLLEPATLQASLAGLLHPDLMRPAACRTREGKQLQPAITRSRPAPLSDGMHFFPGNLRSHSAAHGVEYATGNHRVRHEARQY